MGTEKQAARDKTPIWLKALAGFLGSAVLAFLGFLTSNYLQAKADADARLKLYTDLMSKREEADTQTRQQMLSLMIQTYLNGPTSDLEHKVLGLELLAKNFHESVELSPLFRSVYKQIGESTYPQTAKTDYMRRLEVVAKDVAANQIEILHDSGFIERASVRLDKPAEIGKDNLFCFYFPIHSEDLIGGKPCAPDDGPTSVPRNRRFMRVQVFGIDQMKREFKFRLMSSTDDGEMIDALRTVDYFDFPMLNNIHLSHSQRVAIVLENILDGGADLALAYFPASRASLWDKPYFEELVHDLLSPGSTVQPQTEPR